MPTNNLSKTGIIKTSSNYITDAVKQLRFHTEWLKAAEQGQTFEENMESIYKGFC